MFNLFYVMSKGLKSTIFLFTAILVVFHINSVLMSFRVIGYFIFFSVQSNKLTLDNNNLGEGIIHIHDMHMHLITFIKNS